MVSNHCKVEKARIAGQINKSYITKDKFLGNEISSEDFEKCLTEKDFAFYPKGAIVNFIQNRISTGDEEKIKKAEGEISTLMPVNIMTETGILKGYYTSIDIEKGEYLDNSLNKVLGRVGKVQENEE